MDMTKLALLLACTTTLAPIILYNIPGGIECPTPQYIRPKSLVECVSPHLCYTSLIILVRRMGYLFAGLQI